MSISLDASVLVALLGGEGGTEIAQEFVGSATEPLFVSDFAVGEVASAIGRLVRMKDIDSDAATERLAALDEWSDAATVRLETEAADIRLAAEFVRDFALGLRMPDAIHLASARNHGSTFVTMDRRAAEAAGQLRIACIFLSAPTSSTKS